MKKFDNKVVLVTGGARGMGKTHVEEFVKEGAQVFFTDILEQEGKALETELGNRVFFIKQNVANEDDWKAVAKFIKDNAGRLDILVNNAGIARMNPIENMSVEEYLKVVNINQVSIFLSYKYMLDLLKLGHDSSVINISSIAGVKAMYGSAAYNSSKFAVNALTQVAAIEWANYKIRVNAICPGAIATPMLVQPDTKDMVDEFAKRIPLKRIGEPMELTKMVLFLASNDSSYCTGSLFVADGGSLLV